MKVHEAIIEVMRAIPAVRKEDRNTQQNFSFRGIDAVLSAVGPKLRDYGVVVAPTVLDHHSELIEVGKNRTLMQSVYLRVEYTFYGPEGDSIAVVVPGAAADSGDKAVPKAMSVAFRTALIQTFALPTDEKDPDAEVYERAPADPEPTEVDIARGELLEEVQRLKKDVKDVAKLYIADIGHPIQNETDPEVLRDFTKRLTANQG